MADGMVGGYLGETEGREVGLGRGRKRELLAEEGVEVDQQGRVEGWKKGMVWDGPWKL